MGIDDEFIPFSIHLHVSECNEAIWKLNSALKFITLNHYPLHHLHIHMFDKKVGFENVDKKEKMLWRILRYETPKLPPLISAIKCVNWTKYKKSIS